MGQWAAGVACLPLLPSSHGVACMISSCCQTLGWATQGLQVACSMSKSKGLLPASLLLMHLSLVALAWQGSGITSLPVLGQKPLTAARVRTSSLAFGSASRALVRSLATSSHAAAACPCRCTARLAVSHNTCLTAAAGTLERLAAETLMRTQAHAVLGGACLQQALQESQNFQLLVLLEVLQMHVLRHGLDQVLAVSCRQLSRCMLSLA